MNVNNMLNATITKRFNIGKLEMKCVTAFSLPTSNGSMLGLKMGCNRTSDVLSGLSC